MKKNLLAMFLAVVMIAAVVFIAAPATKAEAVVLTASENGAEIAVVANDTIVDLAGKKNVVIKDGGFTFALADSGNLNDLTGASAGTAVIANGVTPKAWVQHAGYKFLPLTNEDGTYSAHPFNITIDKYGVNAHYSAVSLRVTVIANDVVAKLIDDGEFGLHNYTADVYTPHWKTFAEEGTHGIRAYFYLDGSFAESVLTDNLFATVGAYIKIGATTVESNTKLDIYPKTILETLNNNADTFKLAQKVKVAAMIKKADYAHLAVYCAKFLPRDIASVLLTENEKAALTAITVADFEAAAANSTITNLTGFAPWLYKQANIDLSAIDQSVFNMAAKLFNKPSTGNWSIKTDKNNYTKMLVDGYYGGKVFAEGTSKTFTASDFQVGDLFCAYTQETVDGETVRNYYIAIYQGNGKFLELNDLSGWACYNDKTTAYAVDIATQFQCYYVLRPEQLAIPEEETKPGLSDEKKAELIALTADNSTYKSKTNDTGVIKWFCQQVGMTSTDVKNFSSIVSISTSLFNKPSDSDWTVKAGETTYHKLFVEDYCGGIKFGDSANSKILTAADLEIGDIFCAQDKNSNRYVGLYQGDGKFLMYSCNGSSNNDNYSADYTSVFNADMATNLNYYFVLRPAQFLFPAN